MNDEAINKLKEYYHYMYDTLPEPYKKGDTE